MKKKIFTTIMTFALLFTTACQGGGSKDTQEKIKDRKKAIIGIKQDVPNFGYTNPDTNKEEGFEIDLANLIAEKILGDGASVELVGVTTKTRGPKLENKEVDFLISTFTITEERKKTYNFSTPYYVDEVAILVRKEDNIQGVKDLDGKTVGILQTATSKDSLSARATELGVTVDFSEFPNNTDGKMALASKRIDAFCIDKSILVGYEDENTEIITDGMAKQEYGVAVRKDDVDFAKFIDETIKEFLNDGTIDALKAKWNI